jgi:DNA ligase-1
MTTTDAAPATLADLVATSRAVAGKPGKKDKIELIAALLRRARPDEHAVIACLIAGQVRQKLGVGYAIVHEVLDATPAAATSTLTVADVDRAFDELAAAAGAGSAGTRRRVLGELVARATADERDVIAGLAVGELRHGALDGLVVEAIAKAAGLPAAAVRRAHMLGGDLGAVAARALADGAAGLAAVGLTVFRPVLPMLAQTAADVDEAIAELGEAGFETKLDGARVQIHRDGDEVRVFTRGLNEVTPAVPEVVAVARALPVRRAVLDGEAIALRPDGRPHPFQTTMRRFGRAVDDPALRAQLPLSVALFDALQLDDDVLLDRPARERWAALDAIAPAGTGVERVITADPAVARGWYERAIATGHEGIMAKAPDTGYDAGRRGAAWLKIKKVRRLDLVVLAVEWGSGRRKGWLSNIHLGARDPVNGGFVMLGKTFKGMTDELLKWQTKELLAREIGRDRHVVHVRPELVVEIAFNDVQASPHYPGGLALRFARVVRYRDDKTAAEADTIESVRAIAIADGVVDGDGGGGNGDDA